MFCVLGVGRLKLHIEYGIMQDVMSVTYEKCHQTRNNLLCQFISRILVEQEVVPKNLQFLSSLLLQLNVARG